MSRPVSGSCRIKYRGFSLLEVLVAQLILAIGAGGLALLLMNSVQATAASARHSEATRMAADLAELIVRNPASVGHFVHASDPGSQLPEECLLAAECPGLAWAADELSAWSRALTTRLNGAEATVCRDLTPRDGAPGAMACDGSGRAWLKLAWPTPESISEHPAPQIPNRVVMPLE